MRFIPHHNASIVRSRVRKKISLSKLVGAGFASMKHALDDFKKGKFLIVVDDERRENEGDLIVAADKITQEQMAFMIRHTSGVLCVPITPERLDQLQIPMMHHTPDPHFQTPFALSVDAVGATTGISASDRLLTVKTLISPTASPDDLFSPGHMFPLRADTHGVLGRPGHTEATVDLARLAGVYPAGVLGEIVLDSGEMARLPQLQAFGRKHTINMITIQQLIAYRTRQQQTVFSPQTTNGIVLGARAQLPTRHGKFSVQVIKDAYTHTTHLVLTHGKIAPHQPALVRLHSACTTSEIFGSLRCDCRGQINAAMEMIVQEGAGMIVYLYQEGRGIGLANKIKAYALQDTGMDTVQANTHLGFAADVRDYKIAANILHRLGIGKIRLLTNNPDKMQQLAKHGITITKRIPIIRQRNAHNRKYLETKKKKLGHLL